MNPDQMPTRRDWVEPTLDEIAARVKRARQRRDGIAMTNSPDDEIARMRLSIELEKANWELQSAEACLRNAIKAES